jgi:hypothetical protein
VDILDIENYDITCGESTVGVGGGETDRDRERERERENRPK